MNKYKLSTLAILIFSTLIISCSSNDDGGGDIETEFGKVFVSSNISPVVGIYDFSDSNNVSSVQFGTSSTDSDGIIYSSSTDQLFVASRTNNRIEVYSDLKQTEVSANLNLSLNSTTDFTNARKLAGTGSTLVVSQDASPSNSEQNRFFVYEVNESSITLQNTYDPEINLWDMQFSGNTLYAIQDNSDTLAVYNNFLSNSDGVVSPTQKVQVEGIVRTHALFYSASSDIMLLSDIGDADSGTDGAIHIIESFSTKLAAAGTNGAISQSDQIIIEGSNTQLGNPVGLAFDPVSGKIFVAERKVDGGKLLSFDFSGSGGNLNPFFSQNFSGAAAVYFAN